MKRIVVIGFVFFTNVVCAQNKNDAQLIRKVNDDYVKGWLKGDERAVLSLFEDDAMLSPSGLSPIRGMKAITAFWFPKDSSTTTIHTFTNEIKSLELEGDLAYTMQKTFLSWSYVKGATSISKDQWGIAMTVYRRQPDKSWKIWRQLWTDIKSQDRP
jgi:ketosteroid isomerase-like protein